MALPGLPRSLLAAFTVRNSVGTSASFRHSSIQRLLSSEQAPPKIVHKTHPQSIGPKDGFVIIYKFPSIGPIIGIHKAKRLCFKLLPIAAPISVALGLGEVTSMNSSLLFCSVGVVLAVELYLLSMVTTNHVGFIYASPDMSAVQIAYVDNQGRRKDDIIPTSDIVPLSELPSSGPSRFLYKKLQRYSQPSSKQQYRLNLSHGHITDMDRFTNIFGKVDL